MDSTKTFRKETVVKQRIRFQDAFVAGVEIKIAPLGWGAQKRVAKAARISPSYLNDILKRRRDATEETRRKIARALNSTYDEILAIGRKLDNGVIVPSVKACKKYENFSEEKACCIYQHAAKELGIRESWFFTADSLKRIRPPGWLDYLGREIDEVTLYEIAVMEVKKLK
jgi:transcriptional regulator with XRE-family HTH domain